MEVVILLVLALAVLAVGIRLGMLLAPRVERLADRAGRGQESETVNGTEAEAVHDSAPTDEGDDVDTH
jgi:hypothetical protein